MFTASGGGRVNRRSRASRRVARERLFLDDRAVGDGGVAQNGDDTRSDEDPTLFILQVFNVILVGDDAILTHARVLVDDCVFDDGVFADADGDATRGDDRLALFFAFIVIGTDDHRLLNLAPGFNARAQAHDGVFDGAIRQRGAVRDDRILDVAALDFRRR